MDYCVCCGNYVPEGSMICYLCRKKYLDAYRKKEKRFDTIKYICMNPKKSDSGFL